MELKVCMYKARRDTETKNAGYMLYKMDPEEHVIPVLRSVLDLGYSLGGTTQQILAWEFCTVILGAYLCANWEAIGERVPQPPKLFTDQLARFSSSTQLSRFFPWGISDYDMYPLFAGLIYTRDPRARLTLSELLAHPFYHSWHYNKDMLNFCERTYADMQFSKYNAAEYEQYSLMYEPNSRETTSRELKINLEWKKDPKGCADRIVNQLTSIFTPNTGKHVFMRNRMDITASFYAHDDRFKDVGAGPGVVQDAITVVCDVLEQAQVFGTSSLSVSERAWFALGALAGYCTLQPMKMELKKPLAFYKYMVHGLLHTVPTLSDLADTDHEYANNLALVMYCTEQELSDMDLEYCTPAGPTPVTKSHSWSYIAAKVRERTLQGYNTSDLRALHFGYSMTLPDIRPSPVKLHDMFSVGKRVTYEILKRTYGVSDSSSPSECGVICLSHIGACPVSRMWNFLSGHRDNQEVLDAFLIFVTGARGFPNGDIKWMACVIPAASLNQLPTARTCARLLELPCHDMEVPVDQEPEKQIKFNTRMLYAIQNGLGYGFV